jgi:hypothetical protein
MKVITVFPEIASAAERSADMVDTVTVVEEIPAMVK